MNRRFMLALALGLSSFAPMGLFGQQVDEADAVVAIWGVVTWGTVNTQSPTVRIGCYALEASLGQSACEVAASNPWNAPATWSLTPRLNTRLVPGVSYDVVIDADNGFDPSASGYTYNSGIQDVYLNLSAPAGYVVEINNVYRSEREQLRIQLNRNTRNNYVVPKIRLRPVLATELPAGMATSLMSGKTLWQLSLGLLRNGSPAGTVSFNSLNAAPTLAEAFTRANLTCDAGSTDVEVLGELAPNELVIRQIIAPQVSVQIVGVIGSGNIEIACYNPRQRSSTPDANGYYTFTGDPYVSYLVQSLGSDENGITISATTRQVSINSPFTGTLAQNLSTKLTRTGAAPEQTWTTESWHEGSSALVRSVRARSANLETIQVKDGANNVASTVARTYAAMLLGEEIVKEVSGSANAITTTYDFYTADDQSPAYGKVKTVEMTGGAWQGFEYDFDGRVEKAHGPFNNSDVGLPAYFPQHAGRITSLTYSAGPFARQTRPADSETLVNGTKVAQSATAYTNETPFSGFATSHPNLIVVRAERGDYSAQGAALVTTTRFFSEAVGVPDAFYPAEANLSDDHFRGQIHSVQRPDNVKQSFVYQRGSWDGSTFLPSANGGLDPVIVSGRLAPCATRVAMITGVVGTGYTNYAGYPIDSLSLIPGKSLLEVTIRDTNADVVRTETHVWNGAWNLISWINYSYDLAHHLTQRTSSNGAVWSAVYSGERKTQETDESGVVLSYTYDAVGRIETVTRAAGGLISALTTKFAYSAAGQVTGQTVGFGLSETLVSSRVYDTAGRLTSEAQPGPNGPLTTTYSYNPALRQVTITLPNGGTRVETTQADGRLEQLTGTGVVPAYYTYAIQSGGVGYSKVNLGRSGSSRLQENWTDWLGRTTSTSRPGFTGQAAFEEQATYDGITGRLTRTTRTGFAATLHQYDALSQPTRSGLDLTGNNALDLASADRIADADQYFEQVSNAWWLTKIAKTYPNTGTSAGNPLTVSTTRQRLTGFSGNVQAETVTTDVDGNTVTRSVAVNRSTKTTTITTTSSSVSNSQTETFINELPTSITGFDGLTYTTGYDALGRKSTSIDPRTGATIATYKPNSEFVYRVQDPAGNYVATYEYDSAGRVTAVTNAGGNVTRTGYNTLDQVVRQWGDAAYPVEYGYNDLGERVTMKTYRAGSGWNGTTWPASPGTADWTRWEFDAPSGLLAAKYDAANLNATTGQPITGAKKISYSYNVRGQTATRTWARNVTTTYGYDPSTGELLTQTYTGGTATPNVTYTYTRAGQLDTVTDATGTRDFGYGVATGSHALRLDSISLDTFYGRRVLTRQYDGIKRPNGFYLGDTTRGLSADLTQTYAYHSATGRFDHLDSASAAQANRTFTYGYLTNSALLSTLGVSGTSFTVARTYEPSRDLLTSIDSKWSTASRTRYDYTYNVLGQRATAKQSGAAFADFGGSTYYRYHYNARGELDDTADYLGEDPASTSSPQLSGRHFAYNYDNLGNRTSASRTGTAGTPDTYTPNSLNQYLSRTNPYAHTAGTARSDSTIAVTGGTGASGIGRQGRYWDAQVTLNNTTGPAKADLTVTASNSTLNLTRTEIRAAFLPPLTQSFSYDDDGNLTGDGVWNYTYDAENRLITMTATTGPNSAVGAGLLNRLLEFKYDYLGRRVQKRSTVFSPDGSSTVSENWTRFLYDGNTLVAEFEATSTSCGALLRSYTWGLDLAGSLTATGGVGALVQITQHTGTAASYLPTYDGNGNVASLLRASDGTIAARYEYSPFGELLRAEGSYALSNPFRFSTKFTDDESGLVYYGARYYSPSLGRFINRDPIAEQGGLNLYGFCGNDGANGTDYLGYSWLSKTLKKLNRFGHRLFRALMPIKAIRSMDRRLEAWEKKHYQELKIAAAIVASIVTYGAASEWALGAMSTTTAGATTYSIAGTTISAGTAGVVSAAAGGFTAGVVSSGIQGASPSDVLKSGIIGAIGAGAGMYTVNKLSGPTTSTFTQHVIYGTTNGVVQAGANAGLYGERVDRTLISGLTNGMAYGVLGGLWAGAKAGYFGVKALGLPAESLPAFLFRPVAGLLGAAIGAGSGGLASDWDPRWTAAGAAIGGIVGWSTSDIRIKRIDLGDRIATGSFAIGVDQIAATGGVAVSNGSITGEIRLFGIRVNPSISLPAFSSPIFNGMLARPSWLSSGVSGTVEVRVAPIEFSSSPPIDVFFPQMYAFDPSE